MFGDKDLQDLIDEIGRACDKAEESEGAMDDVFNTVDRVRDESDDARCAVGDTVRMLRNLIRDLVRKQEQAAQNTPDLYTKLNNIDTAMIQLQVAVDEMRLALKGGSDD